MERCVCGQKFMLTPFSQALALTFPSVVSFFYAVVGYAQRHSLAIVNCLLAVLGFSYQNEEKKSYFSVIILLGSV